jgi:predicted ATPase
VSTTANARQAILSGLESTLGSPISSLADHAALLVLDNLEHLQPGVRALEDILSQAPSVKILATARAPLHLAGERVLHVDGLALPAATNDLEEADASALFLQEARRASVGFELRPGEQPYLIELCRLLGGFPLALILAARWMPVIGCSALVQELEKGLDVLASSETDLPERHRSVAGILDSTLAQLTTEERELTDAMALASSDEAASDGSGSSIGIPRRLLTRLRPLSERSLLSLDQAQGTLRLHPLLPAHVRGRARRDRVRAGF